MSLIFRLLHNLMVGVVCRVFQRVRSHCAVCQSASIGLTVPALCATQLTVLCSALAFSQFEMHSQHEDTTENSSAEVGGLGLWAVGLLDLSLALSENEDRQQVKLTPLCSQERQLKFTPPSGLFYDSTAPQADWKSIEREKKCCV